MCHELVHDPIHFHPYMWGWSQYKEDYKLTIIGTISISRWYHVRSDKQDTKGCRKGHFSSKMCLDYEKRRWQLYWEDSCTSSRGPMRRTKCLNFALFASRILFFLSCLVLFCFWFFLFFWTTLYSQVLREGGRWNLRSASSTLFVHEKQRSWPKEQLTRRDTVELIFSLGN